MSDVISIAQSVLNDAIRRGGLGLLTTADEFGVPHSTWMATMATEKGNIVTLTSPDSRKVSNIHMNPNVEWLFTSKDFSSLVYFSGFADVVSKPSELKAYWKLMKEKDRAYFLNYGNSGPGFSIIKTHVNSIRLVRPRERGRHNLDVSMFWEATQETNCEERQSYSCT